MGNSWRSVEEQCRGRRWRTVENTRTTTALVVATDEPHVQLAPQETFWLWEGIISSWHTALRKTNIGGTNNSRVFKTKKQRTRISSSGTCDRRKTTRGVPHSHEPARMPIRYDRARRWRFIRLQTSSYTFRHVQSFVCMCGQTLPAPHLNTSARSAVNLRC